MMHLFSKSRFIPLLIPPSRSIRYHCIGPTKPKRYLLSFKKSSTPFSLDAHQLPRRHKNGHSESIREKAIRARKLSSNILHVNNNSSHSQTEIATEALNFSKLSNTIKHLKCFKSSTSASRCCPALLLPQVLPFQKVVWLFGHGLPTNRTRYWATFCAAPSTEWGALFLPNVPPQVGILVDIQVDHKRSLTPLASCSA
ncbi:hypothetical protein CEXT_452811 [Caerostris extrusa]|uniref:Uncharacterized protein n=1 Tax=Caerostris extrusa TaxID=172846 RepID=A0AAV4V0L4_CAEEX|nr:hypothetical protein CEXT_452811 [Caerostris extrusa]